MVKNFFLSFSFKKHPNSDNNLVTNYKISNEYKNNLKNMKNKIKINNFTFSFKTFYLVLKQIIPFKIQKEKSFNIFMEKNFDRKF